MVAVLLEVVAERQLRAVVGWVIVELGLVSYFVSSCGG